QELQRYDPLDVKLQPCVQDETAGSAPHRLPDSLLFPARSTEYLQLCRRKRCVPNCGEWFLALANTQKCKEPALGCILLACLRLDQRNVTAIPIPICGVPRAGSCPFKRLNRCLAKEGAFICALHRKRLTIPTYSPAGFFGGL